MIVGMSERAKNQTLNQIRPLPLREGEDWAGPARS
jgi:hypothetical protein